ncbi:MAG: hypothetical protein IIT72_09155 [Lachnospiraceae bacterium]|nr:hypothetical protein [Lachnospiraceae bacterium]MBQ5485645.1 hypothetical protein [Lachnospiraceae bacterium]
MSLSVGSISAFAPYGSVAALSSNKTRPKAFDLENKSTVSDAFTESAKVNGARGSVEAVPPVQYPTATVEKNKLSAIEKNQEANQAYNAIADSFAGATGYDQGLHATSYAGVGQNVDEYV